jgi:hypothetical protein
MPLMFGFWSLSVPAGLALYWFISNLSGVVFQYFYMGRKIDWRALLTVAPTPAAKSGIKQRPQREKKTREPELTVATAEITELPAADGTRPDVRRKRHGRRRGKR